MPVLKDDRLPGDFLKASPKKSEGMMIMLKASIQRWNCQKCQQMTVDFTEYQARRLIGRFQLMNDIAEEYIQPNRKRPGFTGE
jgi:transposase-like protein